ncbi:MAG: bifunctional N-acetylglucosamine-1-phosphate uridyltransferase/glucosamine-1-phosphate acetyltransferase, partial [Thermomicrobiaceae bacterium]|nr:bifunctional N-acetylglucosamine-1-phosphate uridyltransferase/glucosamine-1-phosphate acetyltransferase [Thermomicrobiaceae bacterium]
MKSRLPKELHPLAGRPLIDHVLRAVLANHPEQVIVVLSPAKAAIAEALPPGCEVAWQEEPLGTGHATAQALPLLRPSVERVAVLFGDHPLLTPEAVADLLDASAASGALATLLTVRLDDPAGYGRLRREGERIVGVVEAKEDRTEYAGPVEVNSGISCYRRDWLERALPRVPRSGVGEYYLTSLVELAAREGLGPAPVVSVVAPADVAYGINDRVELAAAEAIMRRRVAERLMRAGVTIVDPATTYIDDTVEVGQDTRVEPMTTLAGQTRIGPDCRIGPQSVVRDSVIGSGCEVVASTVEESVVGARVHIGPYAHLRPGTW